MLLKKIMFPQFDFSRSTHTFFPSYFFVSKLKGDLSDKVFIKNELALKTNQLTDS